MAHSHVFSTWKEQFFGQRMYLRIMGTLFTAFCDTTRACIFFSSCLSMYVLSTFEITMKKNRLQAMCAGSLGAMASATGKLGMDGSHATRFCEVATGLLITDGQNLAYLVTYLAILLRGGLIGLTILLNGAMWGLFMESMQGLNSGEAAVLNTGCNILVSAFLGKTIFGETFGTFWWIGASLIVCGMAILQYRSNTEAIQESKLHKT